MNIFCKFTIENYLTVITVFFMVIGGIFALIQWNTTLRIRKSEYLDSIINKLIFDDEMIEAMYIIEYDFIKNNWYNKTFYGSVLEKKIDKYLTYINYILYLRALDNISYNEFNVIKYEINRTLDSEQLQTYLWNLYHFAIINKENCPYIQIINYGIKEKYFKSDFKINDTDLFTRISVFDNKEQLKNASNQV